MPCPLQMMSLQSKPYQPIERPVKSIAVETLDTTGKEQETRKSYTNTTLLQCWTLNSLILS